MWKIRNKIIYFTVSISSKRTCKLLKELNTTYVITKREPLYYHQSKIKYFLSSEPVHLLQISHDMLIDCYIWQAFSKPNNTIRMVMPLKRRIFVKRVHLNYKTKQSSFLVTNQNNIINYYMFTFNFYNQFRQEQLCGQECN